MIYKSIISNYAKDLFGKFCLIWKFLFLNKHPKRVHSFVFSSFNVLSEVSCCISLAILLLKVLLSNQKHLALLHLLQICIDRGFFMSLKNVSQKVIFTVCFIWIKYVSGPHLNCRRAASSPRSENPWLIKTLPGVKTLKLYKKN